MTRKQIIKRCEYWQWKLGLVNWDVQVQFKKVKFKEREEWGRGVANIDTNSQYKFATIRFESSELDAVTDSMIIHEFLHCVLSPLMGMMRANFRSKDKRMAWLDYFHEQTVSELERIIWRLKK